MKLSSEAAIVLMDGWVIEGEYGAMGLRFDWSKLPGEEWHDAVLRLGHAPYSQVSRWHRKRMGLD